MTSREDVVLVTGATGRIGRLVIDELLHTGARVRALTRRPDAAALPPGVEVVAGDFANPPSLDAALTGTASVFLVWTAPPAAATGAIARIAERPGSRPPRIVYLSAPFRTPHPFFQQPNPMRDVHEHVERLLSVASTDTTVLRPGMFSSNVLHWWAPQIRGGDVVRWPYAMVETAPIVERDVAAVAARVLLDARHSNMDYVLTGPESQSHADQLRTIASAIGRPLRYDEVSSDDFRRETSATWPPGIADMLLDAWGAAVGVPAFVTSSVSDILGEPARTFAQWAADNRTAFES